MKEIESAMTTEEMHPEEEWFAQAKKQTPDTIAEFIRHVMNDYHHSYDTVVHAIAACAIAAAWAADKAPGAQGGITGFQAGFVLRDFIRQWEYPHNKTGIKLIDYDKMLYPQYADYFDKTISSKLWAAIQEQARKNLDKYCNPSPHVAAHWQSIADGHVPFGFVVEVE